MAPKNESPGPIGGVFDYLDDFQRAIRDPQDTIDFDVSAHGLALQAFLSYLGDGSKHVVCIGSGASQPVASLAARIMLQCGAASARAVNPYTLIREYDHIDAAVLISYGVSSPDALLAWQWMSKNAHRSLLVTGNPEAAPLSALDGREETAGALVGRPAGRDKGYIPAFATLGLISILGRYVAGMGTDEMTDLLAASAGGGFGPSPDEVAGLFRYPVSSTVVCTSDVRPGLEDLSNRISESALGDVCLEDPADFVHGQYLTSIFRPNDCSVIAVSSGAEQAEIRYLDDRVPKTLIDSRITIPFAKVSASIASMFFSMKLFASILQNLEGEIENRTLPDWGIALYYDRNRL